MTTCACPATTAEVHCNKYSCSKLWCSGAPNSTVGPGMLHTNTELERKNVQIGRTVCMRGTHVYSMLDRTYSTAELYPVNKEQVHVKPAHSRVHISSFHQARTHMMSLTPILAPAGIKPRDPDAQNTSRAATRRQVEAMAEPREWRRMWRRTISEVDVLAMIAKKTALGCHRRDSPAAR